MKRGTICEGKTSAPFKSIPIEGKPNHYYEASIYYAKGGMNYFSGESVQRGYYLSVKPVCRSEDGTRSYMLFSGVGSLLLTATRFSQKVYDSLWGSNHDGLVSKYIQRMEIEEEAYESNGTDGLEASK